MSHIINKRGICCGIKPSNKNLSYSSVGGFIEFKPVGCGYRIRGDKSDSRFIKGHRDLTEQMIDSFLLKLYDLEQCYATTLINTSGLRIDRRIQ